MVLTPWFDACNGIWMAWAASVRQVLSSQSDPGGRVPHHLLPLQHRRPLHVQPSTPGPGDWGGPGTPPAGTQVFDVNPGCAHHSSSTRLSTVLASPIGREIGVVNQRAVRCPTGFRRHHPRISPSRSPPEAGWWAGTIRPRGRDGPTAACFYAIKVRRVERRPRAGLGSTALAFPD